MITTESLKVNKSLFYEALERGVPDSALSREGCFEKVQSELYLLWKYQEKSPSLNFLIFGVQRGKVSIFPTSDV